MQSLVARRLAATFLLLAFPAFPAFAPAQDRAQPPTAASLLEQALYAEEHERDFEKAAKLFDSAFGAATGARDEASKLVALAGAERARARAAGIPAAPQGENDPLVCRVAERIHLYQHSEPNTADARDALRDLALLGAIAVPWLERAIQGRYELCGKALGSEPERPEIYVPVLARVTAPEGSAALDRQLSSPDPLVRRAVAQSADPTRHRAILLRALKDPADAVREQALVNLATSSDPTLFDVMLAAGRAGNGKALSWISGRRPDVLVDIAKDPALGRSTQHQALHFLGQTESLEVTPAMVDALLLLARNPQDGELRSMALYAVSEPVAGNGRTVPAALAKRIEDGLLAALDEYPQPEAMELLAKLGGVRSLRPIVERMLTSEQSNLAYQAVNRIVANTGREGFLQLCEVFGILRPPIRGLMGQPSDMVFNVLQEALSRLAKQDLSSGDIAAGLQSMQEDTREIYLDRVVVPWIQTRILARQQSGDFPPIDPGLLSVVQELSTSGNGNYRAAAASVYGATGDAKFLPQLVSMMANDPDGETIRWAIQRVVAKDPGRLRQVIDAALADPRIDSNRLSLMVRSVTAKTEAAGQILALAESAWTKELSPAARAKLLDLVVNEAPGSKATAFLVAHYGELGDAASSTRKGIIQRIGNEFYEPGTELIGNALRSSDHQVRNAATSAFTQFKTQRALIDSFDEWVQAGARSSQVVDELVALLDSPNSDVVVGAVKGLASMKARTAYPILLRLLDKRRTDEQITAAVKQALDELAK